MEALFGIQGPDFTLIAADTMRTRSIVVLKSNQNKTWDLNPSIVMACSGEDSTAVGFAEYIQKNVQLYSIRNSVHLTTKATAWFTRKQIATSIRTRDPQMVNVLIGGYDEKEGPKLYWIDMYGAMQEVPFAVHGYAANFNLGLLDRNYTKNLSLDQALELLRKCIAELKCRFLVKFESFVVKVIDKNGIRQVNL